MLNLTILNIQSPFFIVRSYTLCFLLSLLFASCAQIVAPTGGTKDIAAPKVEKETPKNKNTSFVTKKIVLQFDEYIQLKDIEDQIVISPPMEEKPIYETKGKSIDILIRGLLKPNTTYTINFGNSITDNHEGNIFGNYHYVFSTGEKIDTLGLRGRVLNAIDNKPEKGLSACLYPIDSFVDSTIIKTKPYYFSKTDEQGAFILSNLPNQSFKLVLFKDENKNLKYDKNEVIAFYDSVVTTTDTLPLNTLFSFKPNTYLINRLIDTLGREIGKFQFAIYKPTEAIIKPKESVEYYTWIKKGKDNIDTLSLFSEQWKTDSVYFTYKNPSIDTTFYIKPRKSAKLSKFEPVIKMELGLNDTFTINFNHPFSIIRTDTSKMLLREDTVVIKPTIFFAINKDYVKLYYPLKEKTKYSLEFKDSAFMDIYGLYNKKAKANYTTNSIKDYSTLTLSFIHPDNGLQYIAQLINDTETKVFKEFILNTDKTLNLEYIVPGKYRIKIIADRNSNGIWDNGDYQNFIQPEKVFYYPEIMNLRAYWDLEQTIDLKKIVN